MENSSAIHLSPNDIKGKWYFIEVVNNKKGDVMKIDTKGPILPSVLALMWKSGQLTADSYVWLENKGSMKDFQQIKLIPTLHQSTALAQFLENNGKLEGAFDVRKAHWYFKDKRGTRQGPHLFDTLAIIWKFHEISSNTLVYANGMADYKPIRNMPTLWQELRAVESRPIVNTDYPAIGMSGSENSEDDVTGMPKSKELNELSLKKKYLQSITLIQAYIRGFIQRKRYWSMKNDRIEAERARRRKEEKVTKETAKLLLRASPSKSSEKEKNESNKKTVQQKRNSTDRSYRAEYSPGRRNADTETKLNEEYNVAYESKENGLENASKQPIEGDIPSLHSQSRNLRLESLSTELKPKKIEFSPAVSFGINSKSGERKFEAMMSKMGTLFQNVIRDFKDIETALRDSRSEMEQELQGFEKEIEFRIMRISHECSLSEKSLFEINERIKLDTEYFEGERTKFSQEQAAIQNERAKLEADREVVQLRCEEERKMIDRKRQENESRLNQREKDIEIQEERLRRRAEAVDAQSQKMMQMEREVEKQRNSIEFTRKSLQHQQQDLDHAKANALQEESHKRDLIIAERADFEQERIQILADLENARKSVEQERSVVEGLRAEVAKEKSRLEYEWAERETYLDQHQTKLAKDKKDFDTQKREYELQLDQERMKLKDALDAIRKMEDVNVNLLGTDRRKVLEERNKMMDEIEAERNKLDEIRIQQNQRELEIHQRVKMIEEAEASLSLQSCPRNHPTTPGLTRPAPRPESYNRHSSANVNNDNASSEMPLPSVRVYQSGVSDETLLGQVTLQPETTIGDLRRIVANRYKLPLDFVMRSRGAAIHQAEDQKEAVELVRSDSDFIIIDS